jgi:hypothetical protein
MSDEWSPEDLVRISKARQNFIQARSNNANVVEFPTADRPKTEAEIDKMHAEAFRHLEGRIRDCYWMSVIALEMVERAIEGRDDKQEKAMFAVFESAQKLQQLKADYQAAWYGEGGAAECD